MDETSENKTTPVTKKKITRTRIKYHEGLKKDRPKRNARSSQCKISVSVGAQTLRRMNERTLRLLRNRLRTIGSWNLDELVEGIPDIASPEQLLNYMNKCAREMSNEKKKSGAEDAPVESLLKIIKENITLLGFTDHSQVISMMFLILAEMEQEDNSRLSVDKKKIYRYLYLLTKGEIPPPLREIDSKLLLVMLSVLAKTLMCVNRNIGDIRQFLMNYHAHRLKGLTEAMTNGTKLDGTVWSYPGMNILHLPKDLQNNLLSEDLYFSPEELYVINHMKRQGTKTSEGFTSALPHWWRQPPSNTTQKSSKSVIPVLDQTVEKVDSFKSIIDVSQNKDTNLSSVDTIPDDQLSSASIDTQIDITQPEITDSEKSKTQIDLSELTSQLEFPKAATFSGPQRKYYVILRKDQLCELTKSHSETDDGDLSNNIYYIPTKDGRVAVTKLVAGSENFKKKA